MATGGLGSLSTKNTCSICLAPFKGRSPKLLPCFHTFCCQCLEQIVHTAAADQTTILQPQVHDHEVKEITIRCPTCRKDCLVPSGGASEFQTNFYVEQEEDRDQGHIQPIICDLCDQGQVASHRCTKCNLNLCFHCNKSHGTCQITSKSSDKTGDLSNQTNESKQCNLQTLVRRARDQLKSFEKMLNYLKEEEMEFNRRRKEVEDKLTDLLDKQMKSIKTIADAEEDRRKLKQADLKRKFDQLNNILSLDKPSTETLEPLLLPDSELSSLEIKRYSTEKEDCFTSIYASLNKMSTISFTSIMPLEPILKQNIDQYDLSLETASLAVVPKEHETRRLNELESKFEVLMKSVHGNGTQGDNDKLVNEVRTMHDKVKFLERKVLDYHDYHDTVETKLRAFTNLIKEFSTQVEFSAYLHVPVRTRTERTLIFKKVKTNVGNCYDESTGKFQAPLSGLYLLYASAMPADYNKIAKFTVMKTDEDDYYDEDDIGSALFTVESSDVHVPCRGELVVHVDQGDKIWAQTCADNSSFCADNSSTYLCGMLLRPDIKESALKFK